MKPYQRIVKRLMDLLGSILALIVLSPLLFLIGLLVRLDSKGPVIFRQRRMGQGGQPFTCCKFRTMVVDAADIRNPDGSTYNAEDDPRVTRVGQLLRRTSLDELPQLLNVLKGDMSLVGPRPDLVDQLSLYRGKDKKRLLVKPGITGWAAIHGRNTLSIERRMDLDVEYVERFSLRLDLEILLRTVPSVLLSEGVFRPQQPEE